MGFFSKLFGGGKEAAPAMDTPVAPAETAPVVPEMVAPEMEQAPEVEASMPMAEMDEAVEEEQMQSETM